MKKSLIIAAALLMTAVACQEKKEMKDNKDIILDNIMTRTSVRAYTAEPVSDADIQTMLKAAMAAPSAKNRQPWEFIVVNERETLDTLAGKLKYAKMLTQAPLAIVVCAKTHFTNKEGVEVENSEWMHDASAACENMLLAAHAIGLGAVWTASHDEERATAVIEALNVPEGYWPLCVVPVGHPAENPEPKDKWKTEKIHYNKW